MGAEDLSKAELFNQLKGLLVAAEDRQAARTDKLDARLDGIVSDLNAWRPRLENRVDALQSAVNTLQQQAAAGKAPLTNPQAAAQGDQAATHLADARSAVDRSLLSAPAAGTDLGQGHGDRRLHRGQSTGAPAASVLTPGTGTDGTLDGQDISGVPSTPTTCSTVCLPRHPVTVHVLVASPILAPPESVFDTNTIQVAMVPLTVMGEISEVFAPMDSTRVIQLQQLYNDSEFFMLPTSSQCITTKFAVHRPMPWPSFVAVHAHGDEARPLPWPSLREISGCEFPSKFIEKAFQCSSNSFREFYGLHFTSFRICAAVEFPILDAYVMVRSLELKLLPNGSTSITVLTVSFDSGNCAALSWEYFWVDSIGCIGSWLIAGCLLAVCWKNSVQSSTDSLIASENVSRLLITLNCSDLKELVLRYATPHKGSNSFRAEGWVAIEFQMSDLCGIPVTYTGYIITHDLCNSCEWNCLADVLLIVEYGGSASYCVQSARTSTTSIVWVPSNVSGFRLLVPSRLELKFLSIGPTSVALLTVLLDSGNFASHWLVSCVCGPALSSSNSVLRDEWVLSPWDPGQAVVSQFDKVFYSQDNFGIYPKNLMLQGLKISGSSDQFVVMRYPLNKVVMPCFNWKPLSMEKPRLYVADCSIPISGDLKEAMERMAISVLWKYLNQAKLKDSGTSISICLRFDSELEMTSVVQFMSSSYYTKVYDLLGEMHDSWENIIFNDSHSTCPSCLNDGVIYTFGMCVAGQTFITYHKLQLLVQGISAELSIHEPSGRYCFSALFSLDLHRVIPLNGSGISSNVVLLSICGKFQGIGSHWQGSIHTEVVTFWLEYSFNRIDKMPQTRQSPHDHCSTGLQIRISVPKFFLCQLFLVMAPLIYLFEKQRLPTWPRPTAYCSLTGNMFGELDVSILALCESRLMNHQEMMQMLIGWPPSVHVNIITNELSCEDNESRCFLGWYTGGPALFLFRAFDRQLVYQGGRSAVISIIRYLVYDSYIANPDCLDSDGLKVLQAPGNPRVSKVALSAAFQEVQLHIPWDPGGSEILCSTTAAWGQAAFQGGRGVRDPSSTSSWAGRWAVDMGFTIHQQPATSEPNYKYSRHSNRKGIQMDHEPASSSSPTSGSLSLPVPSLL